MQLRNFGLLAGLISASLAWAEPSAIWAPRQHLKANLGIGCHIAAMLPGKEGVRSPIDSKETEFGGDPDTHTGGLMAIPYPPSRRPHYPNIAFNLSCLDSESKRVQGGTFPVAFDSNKNEWKKDARVWRQEAAEMTVKAERDSLNELIRATNVVNVNALNSQGWAMTQDDLIGEERGRRRFLSFCLIHGHKAICGSGTVAWLQEGPKGDITLQALEIIRSIEFLEDAPEPAPGINSAEKPAPELKR